LRYAYNSYCIYVYNLDLINYRFIYTGCLKTKYKNAQIAHRAAARCPSSRAPAGHSQYFVAVNRAIVRAAQRFSWRASICSIKVINISVILANFAKWYRTILFISIPSTYFLAFLYFAFGHPVYRVKGELLIT